MAASTGSVSFIGYAADASDGLAFVVLEPVLAGSVINFTDGYWDGAAFSGATASWKWTAAADIAAGTTVTISGNGTSNLGAVEFEEGSSLTVGKLKGVQAFVGSSTSPTILATSAGEGSDVTDSGLQGNGRSAAASSGAPRALSGGAESGASVFHSPAGAQAAPSSFASQPAAAPATAQQPATSALVAPPTFGDGDESFTNDDVLVGGVSMMGGNDTLINSGTIVATDGAAIDMGTGDDTVVLDDGSNIFGQIRLGSGNDTLDATESEGDLDVDAGAGDDIVRTGSGDDLIRGGAGNDMLEGDEGDDALLGGDGNDRLVGGEGDDILLGEAGDDELIGGEGNDVLSGGTGNDTIVIGTDDGTDTIDGGEGVDTVRLDGPGTGAFGVAANVEKLAVVSGSWSISESASYDEIRIANGGTVTSAVRRNGDDRLQIEAGGKLANSIVWEGSGNVVVDNAGLVEASRTLDTVAGVAGTIVFNNAAGGIVRGQVSPTGAGQADATITLNNAGVIEASAGGRVIDFRAFDASGANGIINNLAGGLITNVGPSHDSADLIRAGVDGVVNNWGTISAADGLVGGGDAIDFQGDAGGVVNNHAGATIEGAKHAVTGEKAVTIVNDGAMIGRNGSAVNIDSDGGAENTVRITNRGTMEGRSAEFADSDGDAIDVDGLVYLLNYGRVAGVGHHGVKDGEANISEGIAAGGGTILNYGANAEIRGYGRAIQVDNSGNSDALGTTFINNEGLIQGDGKGPEAVPAGTPAIDLRGNEAINLVGNFADEILNQSSGRIIGGISMGGGADRLSNSGAITATGGSAIDMGDGDDVVNLYVGSNVTGTIKLGAGNDRIVVSDWILNGHTIDGGDGNDDITAGMGNDVVYGGAGNDYIYAGDGDDVIYAGDGDDTILADAGNDVIDGGAGYDTLFLARATGPIYVDFAEGRVSGAGIGADTFTNIENLLFGAGNDQVIGGNADDTFDGGDGNDTLTGGAGDDTLFGAAGHDVLNGGSGDDTLDGGAGDDVMNGGSGDDILLGGTGNDVISGGSGDDRIVGGAGNDVLTGGSGQDTFVFGFGTGHDTIRDFSASGSDTDLIEFVGGGSYAQAMSIAQQVGDDVVFTLDADTSLTLTHTQLSTITADDFRFA
ncbi:calcium-binding protein [Enterovirga sp. CN4-39]|uniref:calcium-binding protein n=1 Tax=Enterovirga sp. CN4-39 TaxID=3400910 RepID=UPI003C0F517D